MINFRTEAENIQDKPGAESKVLTEQNIDWGMSKRYRRQQKGINHNRKT